MRLRASPTIAAALHEPDRCVVVTGGSGWLGRAALEILDGVYGADLPYRVTVFGSTGRMLMLRSGRTIESRAFAEMATVKPADPIILHFAYLTRGYAAAMPPDAYVAINRSLSSAVAALARRCGARGLFLPSSGAVYGRGRTLDHDLIANPYGALKLEDEGRFADLAARCGFPLVAIRIFNMSGPFMNHARHYALGSILCDLGATRRVTIHADHPVIRAFAHVGDVLMLGLSLLLGGKGAGPLDTGGEAIEIGDLARRAARLLGVGEPDIGRPPFAEGMPDVYVGDGRRLAALAAAAAIRLRTLDEQIIDTATFLRVSA